MIIVIAKWLGTFHVQTFTMASGYLFYYLWIEKRKYINIKDSIYNKFKRLIYPYIFTCIFWVIPITLYFYKYNIKEIFEKYFLMISPSQLWFLIMLFLVFVFFFIFKNKIKLSTRNLIYVYMLSTLLSMITRKFNINFFQISNTIEYMFYFYIGGYIYKNHKKINFKLTPLYLFLSIILLFFINYLNEYENYMHYFSDLLMPLLSFFEILSIYIIFTYISKKIKINNRVYRLLESNSFGIYLFHQQIIYFTIIMLNGRVSAILQVSFSFIIALLLSLLMSCMLKKNKYTKKMFGL